MLVCVCVAAADAICSEISSWILSSQWDLCYVYTTAHTHTLSQPPDIPVDYTLRHTSRCHVGQLLHVCVCMFALGDQQVGCLDGCGGIAAVCVSADISGAELLTINIWSRLSAFINHR